MFLGLGGAHYGPAQDLGLLLPTAVAVGDINEDGHEDIASAFGGNAGNTVRIFYGDGTGAFPTSQDITTAGGPISMVIADFDLVQGPDIAILNDITNRVTVQFNRTGGDFQRQDLILSLQNGNMREGLAAADFNGDGRKDLVVANQDGTVSILPFDLALGFVSRVEYPVGFELHSIATADMNLDGAPDVVGVGFTVGDLAVLLNDGNGGLQAAQVVTIGAPPFYPLNLADLNGDGALDAVTGSPASDTISFHLADLSGATAFQSVPGDFSNLIKNADGSFTRLLKDGSRVEFDPAGLMTAFADRNGNTTGYAYDGNGQLQTITDPTGRVTNYGIVAGQLDSVTDPAGRVTRNEYVNGRLVKTIFADGSERRFAYDAEGRVIDQVSERGFVTQQNYGFAGQWTGSGFPDGASVTASISKSLGLADLGLGIGTSGNPAPYARPNGTAELVDGNNNSYSMRFNAFGSRTEINDPIGRTTTLERNADDLVTAVVRPNDGELPGGTVPATVRTEIDYDALGNATAQREAVGTTLERQTLFEYEPLFNKVTKITDPGGFETTFEYDAKGNLTKTINPIGSQAQPTRLSTYDARGLELTRQDANGNVTQFAYDLFGNLEKITDAELNETQFVLDSAGRVDSRTEGFGTPEARTVSFQYDAMNRVIAETDGDGATTRTVYDSASNEIEVEDATDVVVVRAFDERSRLILENDPVQGPVSRTYDQNGNLETLTTALPGQIVTLVYDGVNRIERTTDPLGNDRVFGFDVQDNLVTVKDARQVLAGTGATTFVFDPLGRQIRRTNALNESWSFEYDSRGNRTRTVDAKGQTIDRVFDDLSRQTMITLIESDGSTVEDTITFTYDANGNRLTAKDGDSSLSFTYDDLNQVLTADTVTDLGTVQPATVLSSVYDAVGNRTQLSHGPNLLVVDGAWNYTHDAVGRLTGLASPIGNPLNPVALGYDAAGRLSRIDFPNQVVSEFLYDLDGRPERITHTRGPTELTSFAYGYDAEGKITSITEPIGTRNFTYDSFQQLTAGGFAAAPESYTYDEEGNRIATHLSATHSHDAANRLLADSNFTYTYDANGNLEAKTETAAGAVTSYVWDVQNRLVRVNFPNLTIASYRYDPNGRRTEKDVDGAITRYIYDDDDILLEYDGANALQARYSHGLEVDQPLALERGGQEYAYQIDHLGSVRKLTNSAGTIADTYDTESFGRFETRLESVANPYTFTAREFDPESGFYFYRARYYDPISGRFISEDPIGFRSGDLNLSRYVFNDPSNLIDPTGELSLAIKAFIVAVVAAPIIEIASQISSGTAMRDVDLCPAGTATVTAVVLGGGGRFLSALNKAAAELVVVETTLSISVSGGIICNDPSPFGSGRPTVPGDAPPEVLF